MRGVNTTLRFNEVTFPGTHNSAVHNDTDGLDELEVPFSRMVLNQSLSIHKQLNYGIRALDFEVRRIGDDLVVCHGCPWLAKTLSLGWARLEKVLEVVNDWLHTNRSEIVTVYVNMAGGESFGEWEREKIVEKFRISGADSKVWSYNISRSPDEDWPVMDEMISAGKTLMVMGMEGNQFLKTYRNFIRTTSTPWLCGCLGYRKDSERAKIDQGWNAKDVDDLSPENVFVYPLMGRNRLFHVDCFTSRRSIVLDYPYMFGGNPGQSERVNTECVLGRLVAECQRRMTERDGQRVNWVWVDFFYPSDALIQTCASLSPDSWEIV